MTVPFTALAIADRVALIEQVRNQLKKLVELDGRITLPADLQLAPASEAWLKRMRNALCNHDCSDERFLELDGELLAYYETIDQVEAEELKRRVGECWFVRNALLDYPEASPLEAVLRRVERQAQAA